MKEKTDILNNFSKDDGLRVPENYFSKFSDAMQHKLPYNEAAESPQTVLAKAVKRTWWDKARPYVYMAAMFGGIWCMTKMFSLTGTGTSTLSIDNNPVIAAALSNNEFIDDYLGNQVDEYDLLENMFDQGIDPMDFANNSY